MKVWIKGCEVARAKKFYRELRKVKSTIGKAREWRDEAEKEGWEVGGKLGEVVIGRVFGLAVDWEVRRGAGDRGVDFTLSDGRTLDVKSVQVERNMTHDFKIAVKPNELKTDLVCLVLIAPDRTYGEIAGYMDVAEFNETAAREQWSGDGDTLVISRTALYPIGALLDEERKAA